MIKSRTIRVGAHQDISGHRSGKLTVLQADGKMGCCRAWLCICDCGKTKRFSTPSLFGPRASLTCGCSARDPEIINKKIGHLIKHGMAHHPVYGNWRGVMKRCFSTRHDSYKSYGAVGIKPCGFIAAGPANLLTALGDRPTPSHSVDRIDGKQGYFCGRCPECLENNRLPNLRWASKKEQARNTKSNLLVEINGMRKCATEWAEIAGISDGTMFGRIRAGWPTNRLLNPITPKRRLDKLSHP